MLSAPAFPAAPDQANADAAMQFADETSAAPPWGDEGAAGPRVAWNILVVDDDPDVFGATRFALAGVSLFGRPLQLMYAASAGQARECLQQQPDVALVLLDVVMETPCAGLDLVQHIRGTLGLAAPRIVLRTGQPGYAPEQDTILRYDINDYRTKDELSQQGLLTAVTTALRSYQQIRAIETNRQGLELIVRAHAAFMAVDSLSGFAAAVLAQMAALLGLPPGGLVAGRPDGAAAPVVLAGAGRFAALARQPLQALDDEPMRLALQAALQPPQPQGPSGRGLPQAVAVAGGMLLPIVPAGAAAVAAFVQTPHPLAPEQCQLLEVFGVNLGASLRNLGLLERLHRQAYLDPLLGLPNRTRFIEHIDEKLRDAAPDTVLALVDIDDFSAINELMGHAYGDEVLRACAERLRDCFAGSAVIARMNSNTFGLLGPAALLQPEHVQAALRAPLAMGTRPQVLACTCGFAQLEPGLQDGTHWLKDVGIALKHAKRHMRGRHAVFTPSLGEDARARAQMLANLHAAFAATQLFLVYQPQVDLRSQAVIGLEALLRWRTEDGRFVPPDRFIPVAEQSGLILPLGDWVLDRACRTMRELLDQGLAPQRMAVNVSVLQFQQADFAEHIAQVLRRHDLDGTHLELELTESVAMLALATVSARLAALRALGVSIAIDDFGTGYSSLSYLSELPVDRLKIDRSFVQQIDEARGPRIAELITQLGAKMGLRVLAEGIETPSARDSLLAMGCHEGQGYLFSRPMDQQALRAWMRPSH